MDTRKLKIEKAPMRTSVTRAAMACALAFCFVGCKSESSAPASDPKAVKPDTKSASLGISSEAAMNNAITTAEAKTARLSPDVDVVGSVAASDDHMAIIGPLVNGRIATLNAGIGDEVKKGQILGFIESAEVGEAQAQFLTAKAQAHAANANLARETDLVERRISSARDHEIAVARAATDKAMLKAATELLHAIGFSEQDVAALDKQGYLGGRVPMRASIGGTVIKRFVTLGQAVERATDAFRIADMKRLWVLLDVYEKDLSKVQAGQKVQLRSEAHATDVLEGLVTHVENVIDVSTRTARVRVEFENPSRRLRIGQLVTARILGNSKLTTEEVLAVPRTAISRVDGKPLVFVKLATGGFQRRPVDIGGSGGDLVEVRSGLKAGETVATDGAFLLKSELLR
jgi:membrane fusion protein, heavy metal efflux system